MATRSTTAKRKAQKDSTQREPYSKPFLQRYGAGMKSDEIRLVQAYRGLGTKMRAALLTLASYAIIAQAEARAKRGRAR
jgi:hypothetical protein